MKKSLFITGLVLSAQVNASLIERLDSRILDQLTRTKETYNKVELLHLGMRSKPARYRIMNEAKNYVFITAPFWIADEYGEEFFDYTKRLKKYRGKDFDFRLTAGSKAPITSGDPLKTKIFKRLEDFFGKSMEYWNRPDWGRSWGSNLLDHALHDKMVIVDGKKLLMGGMNIATPYMDGGITADGWHDTDILIEGPAVQVATDTFIRQWETMKYLKRPKNPFPVFSEDYLPILHDIFYDTKIERHEGNINKLPQGVVKVEVPNIDLGPKKGLFTRGQESSYKVSLSSDANGVCRYLGYSRGSYRNLKARAKAPKFIDDESPDPIRNSETYSYILNMDAQGAVESYYGWYDEAKYEQFQSGKWLGKMSKERWSLGYVACKEDNYQYDPKFHQKKPSNHIAAKSIKDRIALYQNETYFPEISDNPEYKSPVRLIYENSLVDRYTQPVKSFSKTLDSLKYVISMAQESVELFFPYMSISSEFKKTLIKASKRLKVRIITNSLDSHDMGDIVYFGALQNYPDLIKAGVEIYEWNGQKATSNFPTIETLAFANTCHVLPGQWPGHTIHTKAMMIDGEVTFIGSHNFNIRSENHNSEVMAMISDRAFTQQLVDLFNRDLDFDSNETVQCRDYITGQVKAFTRPPMVKRIYIEDVKRTVRAIDKNIFRKLQKSISEALIRYL